MSEDRTAGKHVGGEEWLTEDAALRLIGAAFPALIDNQPQRWLGALVGVNEVATREVEGRVLYSAKDVRDSIDFECRRGPRETAGVEAGPDSRARNCGRCRRRANGGECDPNCSNRLDDDTSEERGPSATADDY